MWLVSWRILAAQFSRRRVEHPKAPTTTSTISLVSIAAYFYAYFSLELVGSLTHSREPGLTGCSRSRGIPVAMLGMEQLRLASGCGCCLTVHAAPIAADHVYNFGHSHSSDDQSSPSQCQVRSLHPMHTDLHPGSPTAPFHQSCQ